MSTGKPWEYIALEFVTQPISNPKDIKIFQRLCEEISKLRVSENRKHQRVMELGCEAARLRAALHLLISNTRLALIDDKEAEANVMKAQEALTTTDGQKELEAVEAVLFQAETMGMLTDEMGELRDAFGLGHD